MNSKNSQKPCNHNPSPHVVPKLHQSPQNVSMTAKDSLIVCTVGLPLSGKTCLTKRIAHYFSFFHDIPSRIFKVETFHDFQSNEEANVNLISATREVMEFLMDDKKNKNIKIAFVDATNHTKEIRKLLVTQLKREKTGAKVIFIEVIKPRNYQVNSLDCTETMEEYKVELEDYETLEESEKVPFVKIRDSQQFEIFNIRGFLALTLVHYILNVSPKSFSSSSSSSSTSRIFLSRHGESEYNELGKIGGDSGLSYAGKKYAQSLALFMKEELLLKEEGKNKKCCSCQVWTSTLRRTVETAQFLQTSSPLSSTGSLDEQGLESSFQFQNERNLDEIYAGSYDGMTYDEIKLYHPVEFQERKDDKLNYRYPRGESYLDVSLRLEPMVQAIEASLDNNDSENILIIGHLGVLRVLYCYFKGIIRDDAPFIDIPLNVIIELSYNTIVTKSVNEGSNEDEFGCKERRFKFIEERGVFELQDNFGKNSLSVSCICLA